jgi:hypothetical protein
VIRSSSEFATDLTEVRQQILSGLLDSADLDARLDSLLISLDPSLDEQSLRDTARDFCAGLVAQLQDDPISLRVRNIATLACRVAALIGLGFHDEFDWPFPGIVEPRKRSAATCHVRASRDVPRSKRPQLIPQQDSGTSAAVDVLVSGYASSLRFP